MNILRRVPVDRSASCFVARITPAIRDAAEGARFCDAIFDGNPPIPL